MGLDMYLSKKTYIGGNYEHRNVTGDVSLKIGDKPVKVKTNRISYIIEHVGYWRKANQIHQWFVDNVQEGEDECREYDVSSKQLKELLELCKQIKDSPEKASELLPVQEGFFFGSQEYDEGYMQDINDTIKIIETVLSEENENEWEEYSYQASW
jgi:hypothetical protein